MAEVQDSVLVSRVRAGDLSAFEALYDRYKTMVYRTACAITRDQSAAEEVTQECFVRAYRSLDKVDASSPLGPWFHRIAANLSYNWWRNARREQVIPLGEALEEIGRVSAETPSRAVHNSEVHNAVMEALQSLPFEQRVTVTLFYLNAFCIEEIAYVLDCPVGTVKSRLHYGRLSLKRKLERVWQTTLEVAYDFR